MLKLLTFPVDSSYQAKQYSAVVTLLLILAIASSRTRSADMRNSGGLSPGVAGKFLMECAGSRGQFLVAFELGAFSN